MRALVFVVLAALGCTTVSEPLPSLAEQVDAPAAYEHWWAMTQECSGRTGDFASIHWYVVPGATSMTLRNGAVVDGYWDDANHRIVLAGAVQLWGDVVRHEMLHALLGRTRGHPRAQFIQNCGGIVACEGGCQNEGTPALPDSSWTHVLPSQLPVTLVVDPAAPSGTLYGVVTVGRPVARENQNGWTLEATRLTVDTMPNACSMLYAAAWRAARALGWRRLITYTLKTEPGTSLRAAGWKVIGEVKGRSWSTPSRPRIDKHPTLDKICWEAA
jgi:hypothetical protein